MEQQPNKIFNEFKKGCEYKSAFGDKGIFNQSKINERFYIGDQWHGAKCGNERPLVRHNIIKRIGDYKMSQILNTELNVMFTADGISQNHGQADEINSIMNSFGKYYKVTAERVKLNELYERILRNAYITGSAILYTYWDSALFTGLYADEKGEVKIKGDICCEVLNIEDVVFGDPYITEVQKQPFIIISSRCDTEQVLKEARAFGGDLTRLRDISNEAIDGKVTVLTRLYKKFNSSGSYDICCTKSTENAVVREEFKTGLKYYPISLFNWERKNNSIYGESEITYLIPNQIAINRMITANVWASMTAGMPIMLVNGDTVTDKITNDPGQIIKVFGSNEDVEAAVKYISPPSFSKDFDTSINTLIENTLAQSGANEVALGDSRADNASALATMRSAALMPLQIIKNRFYSFVEDSARIWADFWVSFYGKRSLKISENGKTDFVLFDGDKYKNIIINTGVDVSTAAVYSEREHIEILLNLFDKGIINKKQLLSRMPAGTVSDIKSLLEECEEQEDDRI